MGMNTVFAASEPAREEVDALPGATLLEFGTPWCPHCLGAQRLLAAAMAAHPELRHLKVEDGRGQPLGRSFRVKYWPTLIFLRDGVEVARVVRPGDGEEIAAALALIDPVA